MEDNRFGSLQELIDAIEMGLDIECILFSKRYYIGWSNNQRVIALCPDGDGDFFETLEQMLAFEIDGQPLKDCWAEIELLRM